MRIQCFRLFNITALRNRTQKKGCRTQNLTKQVWNNSTKQDSGHLQKGENQNIMKQIFQEKCKQEEENITILISGFNTNKDARNTWVEKWNQWTKKSIGFIENNLEKKFDNVEKNGKARRWYPKNI